MFRSFAFLLVLATAGSVFGQGPGTFAGPAPSLALVTKILPDKASLVVQRQYAVQVPVQIAKTVVVNGKSTNVVETVLRSETRISEATIELSKWKVITTKGKTMLLDEVLSKLKPNTVIAQAATNAAPDPRYLSALNPDLMILVPLPGTKN